MMHLHDDEMQIGNLKLRAKSLRSITLLNRILSFNFFHAHGIITTVRGRQYVCPKA